MTEIKFLAYYLPQYHPIPENDNWWGKGFTEWTNVAKAKPLFKGHYQPILPANLGFYDLRVPEVRRAQEKLALDYGIDGFIYYQYWFGNGKMLLEGPAEEKLNDHNARLPFCFCWANETWKGIWHGLDNPTVLIEQQYNGLKGYIEYFNYLLPFFNDARYIKVDNKPMFHIYRIDDLPDKELFFETFNGLAIKEGFDGIYFISTIINDSNYPLNHPLIYGQVGVDTFQKMRYSQISYFKENSFLNRIEKRIKKLLSHNSVIGNQSKPKIYDYVKGVENFNVKIPHRKYITCVFPNWDNSARSGKKSMIFKNSNPIAWRDHLQTATTELLNNPQNPPFIFIKSWNEWAEGNHLEPDQKYGLGWLEAVAEVKEKSKKITFEL